MRARSSLSEFGNSPARGHISRPRRIRLSTLKAPPRRSPLCLEFPGECRNQAPTESHSIHPLPPARDQSPSILSPVRRPQTSATTGTQLGSPAATFSWLLTSTNLCDLVLGL